MSDTNHVNNFIYQDFSIPQNHNALVRNRLEDSLLENSRRKLIVISAKAGQGKTTLMASFLRKEKSQCAWIDLSMNDSDSLLLINKIKTALYSILVDKPISNVSLETLFKKVSRTLEEPLYIVIDNFYFINHGKKACAVIDQIIGMTADGIHIVLLSRERPSISYNTIRAQREIFELADKDLSFTDDEVEDLLLKNYKLELEKKSIDKINSIILGWPIGYVFLFEKLSNAESSSERDRIIDDLYNMGGLPEFFDFFEREILIEISEENRIQLTKLSFFNIITPSLIEKIIDVEAHAYLEELKGCSCFVRVIDKSREQYSFHPLYQYILQTYAKDLDKEEIDRILTIGIDYYRESENYEKVISNLLILDNIDDAQTEFVTYAEKLLDQSKYREIRKILDLFPVSVVQGNILLEYYKVIANNLKNPFKAREEYPRFLEYFHSVKDFDRQARIYSVLLANYFFYQENSEIVSSTASDAELFLENSGHLLSEHRKEILLALIPIGHDWKEPVEDIAFERAMMAEETSQRFDNHEAFLCSRLVLSRKYIQKGEFASANDLLNKTKRLLDVGQSDNPYNSLVNYYLSDTFFYLGEIYKAIECVMEALTQTSKDFSFNLFLKQNLILYYLYLDKHEPAELFLEETKQNEKYGNRYYKYFNTFLLPMLNAYRKGNRRRADYYSKRLLEDSNEAILKSDYPYSFIQLIEVNISLENYDIAEKLISTIEQDISEIYMPFSSAAMYALKGLLLYLQKNNKKAMQEFEKMNSIILRNGYKNLDICSPELLDQIARVSRFKYFENFPRLKYRLVEGNVDRNDHLLEIKTLGTFSLYINGKEIPSSKLISQKRVMDLLKYLIIYRKNGILKEVLYKSFWPNYSSKSCRDNLNTIIYRLRNILGKDNEILLTDANTIGFLPGTTYTDIDRYLKVLRLASIAENQNEAGTAVEMYKEAIQIYKGDFLENDIYSDFIRDERENIRQKHNLSLFKLSKLYLQKEDYQEAHNILKILLNRDPQCESGSRLLMVTSVFLGSRSSIPRILDNLNRQLFEAYGVSADDKTIQLKNALLSGSEPGVEMWKDETMI